MKRVLTSMLLMLLVPAATVFAQVTLSYDAVITSASGPHAARFPAGERVAISYTLDEFATDTNGDPSQGIFPGAVLSLSINFTGLGIFANGGPGLAQTFNNLVAPTTPVSSDQVFIHGGPIGSASPLGGETITQIEVDFLSGFVPLPGEPTMLPSDALPLFALPMTDSFVILRTATGTTFVNFGLSASGRVDLLVDDVETLLASGDLTSAEAAGLLAKLDAVIRHLGRGRTTPACNQLQSFVNQVNDFIASGVLTAAQGQPLLDAAHQIQVQIGCS